MQLKVSKAFKNFNIILLLIVILICFNSVALADKDTIRPNIILIVADDLGYGDLSITGSDTPTPNIDRLFTEGVSFDRAYANSPLCTPSRAALLTGQYQQRTSIDRNILFYERDIGMRAESLLIPELLKEANYRTALIGKWHLGYTAEAHPNNQGFDEFVGLISGSANYYTHKNLGMNDLWKNDQEFYDDRYSTDLFTDEAISFIDKQVDEPFFLYMPYTAPHTPFQSPQHRGAIAYKGQNTAPIALTIYQQMIQNLDENIGRLVSHLEENDLAENTIIVFTSDHGGIPSIADNGGLLGGKSNLTEGGLRIPLAIYGPMYGQGLLPQGKVVTQAVALIDILPTFLDFANVEAPAELTIDGLSLNSLISENNNSVHHDALFFESYGVKVMIEDNWKYFSVPDGRELLFDIRDEETDLAEVYPDRVVAMARAHQLWQTEIKANVVPLPNDRDYGQQAVWGEVVLDQSVAKEPDNFLTQLVSGVFHRKNGDLDKALTSFNSALELSPNSIEARMQRSNLYREQENYTAAFTDLNWILENYQGNSKQLNTTVQKELCKLADYINNLPVDCSGVNN